jgi:endonuclease/exonuclease/phosphatase family metal-dependent hydrolase
MVVETRPTDCRTAVTAASHRASQPVRWLRPDDQHDRQELDAWCRAVGPAVVELSPARSTAVAATDLVIVSWNIDMGAGDIVELVRQLRAGGFTEGRRVEHFALLLQEAYRAGPLVPRRLSRADRAAGAIATPPPGGERTDIVRAAASLGLSLFYAPSMRNGSPRESDEDRGNAILSTEPLSELTAIELPFERQRRVSIEATVSGMDAGGEPWTMRLTDVHLDNRAPARRLWLLGEATRLRQARGLRTALTGQTPAVLGGDLNTWNGFGDAAYRELAGAFTSDARHEARPTFAGLLRLDHLLFRLPDGWSARTTRLERFGSDHHPLLAELDQPASLLESR